MAIQMFPMLQPFGGTGESAPIYNRGSKRKITDTEKARLFKQQAWNDAGTVTEPAASIEANKFIDSPEVEGMSLAVPEQKRQASPEERQARYVENLKASGLGEFADQTEKAHQEFQQNEIINKNKQAKLTIDHLNTGLAVARSGDIGLGIEIANQMLPEGQRLENIKFLDHDNAVVFSEDKPEGEKIKLSDLATSLASAEKQMEGYFPVKKEFSGDKIVYSQTSFLGKTEILTTIDNPTAKTKERKFTPYEKKSQQDAADAYAQSVADDRHVDATASSIDAASQEFANFLKKGGSTGPSKHIWGTVAFNKDAQALESKFNKVSLNELVEMFQGKAKSIDSDSERTFYNKTQPSVTNQPITNAKILVGATAARIKQRAENIAMREYLDKSEDKMLQGYDSPVVGKKVVMFSKTGEGTLVDKAEVKAYEKKGYSDPDKFAQKMLTSHIVPKVTKESFKSGPSGQAAAQEPAVVETRTINGKILEKLSDGTVRVKK